MNKKFVKPVEVVPEPLVGVGMLNMLMPSKEPAPKSNLTKSIGVQSEPTEPIKSKLVHHSNNDKKSVSETANKIILIWSRAETEPPTDVSKTHR